MPHSKLTIVTMGVLALIGLAPDTAEAAKEGTLYYVNDFDGSLACGGSDLRYGDDTVGYLRDKLDSWSFDSVYYGGNTFLDFPDVTDPDIVASGDDNVATRGVDSADVGMLYSHGSYSCGTNDHSSVVMGDNRSTCRMEYGSGSTANDSWWGDTDLNVMIIDTCLSAQYCAWNAGGYYHVDGNFAMLLGFHGISYDSNRHTNNFEDFVDDSRFNGLGDNWVDEVTRRPLGSDNDECAVAVVYEDTASAADSTFDFMGFDDWKTPGSHTASYYYYINNCDPRSGKQL